MTPPWPAPCSASCSAPFALPYAAPAPAPVPTANSGAVSFLHRFGSALNPHFHFHVVVLDGLFAEEPDASVTFHEASHLSPEDVDPLQRTLQRRVLRLFQKRGLLDDHTVADMLTWEGAGGFSLDASVRIHGSDSAGRERLLRYCARPPFALERLRVQRHPAATGRDSRHSKTTVRQVLYHPPRPTPDGRTVVVLSPLEFLAALARLIPPPRPPPPLPRRPSLPTHGSATASPPSAAETARTSVP